MKLTDIPAKFQTPFAANASSGFIRAIPATTTDPTAASLDLGFPPETFDPPGAGGSPPDGKDFNGILNQSTSWDQWFSMGGAVTYDSAFSALIGGYPNGAVVGSAVVPGFVWRSIADDNTTDPDAGGAGWVGSFVTPGWDVGGYVNKFRNVSCVVATRGTSGSITSGSAAYSLDGHYLSSTGAALGWASVAGIGRAPRSVSLSCAAGISAAAWAQPVESFSAAPLAGQIVTVQVKIRNLSGADFTPGLSARYLNSSDVGVGSPWTGGSPVASTAILSDVDLQPCPNGATTTVTYSFLAPVGAANGLLIQVNLRAAMNQVSGSVVVGDLQINATPGLAVGLCRYPPALELRGLVAEQAECARFLPAFAPGSSGMIAPGGAFSDPSSGAVNMQFPTPTRIEPTSMVPSSPAHFSVQGGGQNFSPSALSLITVGVTGAHIGFSGVSYPTPAVQGWDAALAVAALLAVQVDGQCFL